MDRRVKYNGTLLGSKTTERTWSIFTEKGPSQWSLTSHSVLLMLPLHASLDLTQTLMDYTSQECKPSRI
jgi:hypothetical protein